MSKLFWRIAIFCAPMMALAQSDNDLDRLISEKLQQEELTGASWSIFDKGVISTGAAGFKNAKTKEMLNPNDKIQIGSITKTLIATGILRLVTQGKLTLESPIVQILPHISFDNPWKGTHSVTVKNLLNHTSGLQDAEFWQVFSEEAKSNTPLIEVFDRKEDVLLIRTTPGSRFSYSNMGYTLLGLVIEKITGEDYELYLDKNLLNPLGMKNSTFQFITQDTDPDLAMGHFDEGTIQQSMPMYLRPAGQFTTTANDMALFAHFLLSDGKIDGRSFIESNLLKAMGKPISTEANQNGLARGYQYGLSYRDRYGVIGYYHSGNIIGYRATFYLFPEDNKAFFISFNADSETADYQAFNEIFSKYLNITRPIPLKSVSQVANHLKAFEGYYKLSPIRFELFAYFDLLFNSIRIRHDIKDNKLTVHGLQQNSYSLLPSGNLFRKDDRVRSSHIFYEKAGNFVYTDGLSTYESVNLSYLVILWLNLVFGVIGILIILLRGIYSIFAKQHYFFSNGLWVPFIAILFLLTPIPFFFFQSFLQIGDLTIGNLLLTIVSGILPLALFFGLVMTLRKKVGSWKIDLLAILFLLQWLFVLTYWGLIPFKLWEV